ncbi:MAG: dihydroneopterin aldolase [Actinomycetes bacterium]
MADTVRITGLRVHGRHGVLEQERRDGQEFVVDVELSVDVREAATTDDLSLTADYGALSTALADVVAGDPVQLLETLATRLADVCLADPAVRSAVVTVHKPAAPLGVTVDDVSVTVRRP